MSHNEPGLLWNPFTALVMDLCLEGLGELREMGLGHSCRSPCLSAAPPHRRKVHGPAENLEPPPRTEEAGTLQALPLHSGSHRACAGGGSNPRDTPPSTSPSPQSEPDSRQWERECFQKVRDDCSGLFSTISNNPPHSLSLRPCPERPRALQKESSPALLLDRRYYVPPLTDEETKPTG